MPLKATTYEAAKLAAARYAENRKAKLASKPKTRKSRSAPLRASKSNLARNPISSGKAAQASFSRNSGTSQRPAKRRRGTQIDLADKYFSLFVRFRDRWTCQRCRKPYEVGAQGLHNSHHFGRARENTRFDPMNCDALCHGCHSFFTANPADHCAWKLARVGQVQYDLLTLRANERCKKDRKLMAIVCKKLYEEEKARFEST